MPIKKITSEKKFLARKFGKRLPFIVPHEDITVLSSFHLTRRQEQINLTKQGCNELREYIGKEAVEHAEERGLLKFTCFFDNSRGRMEMVGILASYVKQVGKQLWWEPDIDLDGALRVLHYELGKMRELRERVEKLEALTNPDAGH